MKKILLTVAAAIAITAAWVSTAPSANAAFAPNPMEMQRALHQVAQDATERDEWALRNAVASTFVIANGAQCRLSSNQPVQGYAYYSYDALRPVVCVSNWRDNKAQSLIVWSHEVAHVMEFIRDPHHFEHPHGMSHYHSTYDILSVAVELADISKADEIRLKAYYRLGTVIAPFSERF